MVRSLSRVSTCSKPAVAKSSGSPPSKLARVGSKPSRTRTPAEAPTSAGRSACPSRRRGAFRRGATPGPPRPASSASPHRPGGGRRGWRGPGQAPLAVGRGRWRSRGRTRSRAGFAGFRQAHSRISESASMPVISICGAACLARTVSVPVPQARSSTSSRPSRPACSTSRCLKRRSLTVRASRGRRSGSGCGKRSAGMYSVGAAMGPGLYGEAVQSVLDKIGEGLANSALMFWEVWWALVLGFAISAIVQAWVPRERSRRRSRAAASPPSPRRPASAPPPRRAPTPRSRSPSRCSRRAPRPRRRSPSSSPRPTWSGSSAWSSGC